jgi:FAD/FMN-containing dehydrogenase
MTSFRQYLIDSLAGKTHLIAFPEAPLFQFRDLRRRNLDISVTPAAIVYPESNEQVAAIVKSAAHFGLPVQARSGGHSYGNYSKYKVSYE